MNKLEKASFHLLPFPQQLGLERRDDGRWYCPKCSSLHGNDWRQCKGACPVVGSPHYRRLAEIGEPLLKVLDRWDELSAAIDRVVTALPEQMTAAAAELEAQRKLMREEPNSYTRGKE